LPGDRRPRSAKRDSAAGGPEQADRRNQGRKHERAGGLAGPATSPPPTSPPEPIRLASGGPDRQRGIPRVNSLQKKSLRRHGSSIPPPRGLMTSLWPASSTST